MFLRILYFAVAVVAVLVAFRLYQVSAVWREAGDISAPFVAGPENADLTVVLFFDYQCPYCKQGYATFLEAMKRDGKVRLVLRPLATQGIEKDSVSRQALAASRQGKFLPFHDLLMESYVPLTETVMRDFAAQAGIDYDRLLKDSREQEILDLLSDNGALAVKLRIDKVPTFLFGKIVYVPQTRMPEVEDFLKLFAEARAAR